MPDCFCPYCEDPNTEQKPVTAEFMSKLKCDNPDCAHEHGDCLIMELSSHPKAGVNLYYCRKHAVLIVRCAECSVESEVFLLWSGKWEEGDQCRALMQRLKEVENERDQALELAREAIEGIESRSAVGPQKDKM